MAVSSPVSASKKKAVEETTDQKQRKQRSKCPGVRVIGARIYDSEHGKTCHQCRQKTMDFTARCKNMKNDKQCTIMFCHKCLHNRYGENAEEMASIDDWHCPRCRDICNCSFCMRKKGHKPTGILVHTAKATGFTSVSQLLDVKGPAVVKEVIFQGKVATSKISEGSTKDQMVSSPVKLGKENAIDGNSNVNLNKENSSPDGKKAKKAGKDELKKNKKKVETPQVNGVANSPIKDNVALRRSPRKFVVSLECNQEKPSDKKANAVRRSPRKFNLPEVVTKTEDNMDNELRSVTALAMKEFKNKIQAEGKAKKTKAKEDGSKVMAEGKPKKIKVKEDAETILECDMDVTLPPGTLLTNVAGIDLDPQDAGYALQFLEFCSSFGEILKLRKGQPECVLRDILSGRRRKGKCTSSVQFIIQLLTFMEEDDSEESPSDGPNDGDTSWIWSLKNFLSEVDLAPEDIPDGWFDKGGEDRYDMLNPSPKLRLLTFLCDETLATVEMRNWMEEQNLKFIEKGKEAKESLNAAKEKEKLTKRRMQEEIVKALMAKNGIPLTVSEHETIVAEIKAESKRVQDEVMDAMGLVSKKRHRSDAVRTEPIIVDDSGHAFWRLDGLGETTQLMQDMGAVEEVAPNDKWYSYDDEELKIVDKYMTSARYKKQRTMKLAACDGTIKGNCSSPEDGSSSNDDKPVAT